jgi:Skp family chaperone for outer membrane proteins
MIRPAAIALLLAATMLEASASPRIALVRVTDIYAGLESTAKLEQQVKLERDAILSDERAANLRRVIDELKALQARLSDKNKPLDEEGARQLARTYELRRQEAQTLQREFEGFRAEREREINRKMVSGMRASLDRIHETARRVAGEHDCDLVLDSSGHTNTGAPFILYQKDTPDLTVAVKAALEDSETTAESPAPSNP